MDKRVTIAVTSYRFAKHDPDGICSKYAIDAIVKAGLLSDDSTDEVKKICHQSKKAQSAAQERTIIEIYSDGENVDDAWC